MDLGDNFKFLNKKSRSAHGTTFVFGALILLKLRIFYIIVSC